jgi:hypothetical protein
MVGSMIYRFPNCYNALPFFRDLFSAQQMLFFPFDSDFLQLICNLWIGIILSYPALVTNQVTHLVLRCPYMPLIYWLPVWKYYAVWTYS